MDDLTADAFANRDDPVPLLTVTYSDVDASSSEVETDGRRERLRKSISPSRLREKAQEKAQGIKAVQSGQAEAVLEGKPSIQDRLFAKLLQQVIPSDDLGDDELDTPVDRRSSQYIKRPAFSLPMMTNNFRRFNARIGIVFVFQNRMIRLFGWRNPTHTIAFLATYTFVCLDPSLLIVLPLVVTLLFIMVPAFISRHPPPPTQSITSTTTPYYSTYTGPALAPARTIKPAPETSKDFFRNMRDLQNSMADFSSIHDSLIALIAPVTNFSNEIVSSTIFLYISLLTIALFITSHLLPWRLLILLAGHSLIISAHPTAQAWLIKAKKRAERRGSIRPSKPFYGLPLPPPLQSTLTALSTITLSSTPETREVEIFELQHRPLSSLHDPSLRLSEWQAHLFTPSPYDPLSPARIAGDRPRGTRFFEDVQPPEGWEWHGKKWELDLEAGEWIGERLIVGVEFDVLHRAKGGGDADDDGENEVLANMMGRRESINGEFGGWVWDLPPALGSGGRDEEVWLAYGDYEIPSGMEEETKKKRREKAKNKKEREKDWEEATRYGARGRTGEWRRRRWVRLVRRKQMGTSE